MEEIYTSVGRALSSWSFVEEALCAIFSDVVTPDPSQSVGAARAAFWTIESFRGKLLAIESAIRLRCFERAETISKWETLQKRAAEKNRLRNEIAHATVMNYGPPDHTYLVPSLSKTFLQDIPRIHREVQQPDFDLRPANRLTAKEIRDRTESFEAFTIRLNEFNGELHELFRQMTPHWMA